MENKYSKKYIFVTLLSVAGFLFVSAISFATTPNPGHPWTEVGDGTFIVTGPTVARTYTFPDVDTTILTSNSAVTVPQGGTGLTGVSQGDILYGSAANTLSALGKDTNATRYLSNTGTTNNPAWAQIDLTNGVTGILPGANGGTGNGYTAFTGPTTSTKTFTLPDASATILTDNAPVTLAQGGTGISLSATSGVLYSTAAAAALLPVSATARQILLSGSNSAPSWSTATYPSTSGSAGVILRSDGTNFLTTTATYPDTAGTVGNILYDNGTNFVSLPIPDSTQFSALGMRAGNISATTARTDGVTYFQYMGVAPKAYTQCKTLFNVTQGLTFITWAEVAIFKGTPVSNGNASLTLLGYTSVTGWTGSPGRQVTTVSVSGISAGDHLWVAYGSLSTGIFQVRGGLADDIQSGFFQTATVRPSLASSPQATTLAGAAVIPGWPSMTCS